jgi:hypothetical protein
MGTPMIRRQGSVVSLGRAHRSERDYATALAMRGFDVILLGRNHPGADLVVDGESWELKTLRSCSTNAVRSNLRLARRQCTRVVLDGREVGLRVAVAARAACRSARAQRLVGVLEIVIECGDGRLHLSADGESGAWLLGNHVI